jgi:hypothetical protein
MCPSDTSVLGIFFFRHWGRGVILLPGGMPLVVHSAHLYPAAGPSRPTAGNQGHVGRDEGRLQAGDPCSSWAISTTPGHRGVQTLDRRRLIDTFAKVGEGEGLTIRADTLKRSIDYVMAAGPIANQITSSRPLFEGAFRLNTLDDHSFALSDHVPSWRHLATRSDARQA